jgi:Glycosyl hydrolase family 99
MRHAMFTVVSSLLLLACSATDGPSPTTGPTDAGGPPGTGGATGAGGSSGAGAMAGAGGSSGAGAMAGAGGSTATGDADVADALDAATIGCEPYEGTADNPTLPYYRLRIEFTSRTDWTGLSLVDSSHVIKARTMSTAGAADNATATFDHISLNQPLAAAQAGASVAITADYALSPQALETPLTLKLEKGVAGPVNLKVSGVVGDTVTLLREIDNPPPSEISFDLSALEGTALWHAPMAPVTRMGWAVYYPWYNLDSWTDPAMRDPAAVPYASDNPADLERQMDQALGAGIQGFLSSWWGPGSGSDKNLALLLDAAQKKGFHMGIFFETLQNGAPLPAADMIDWLTYYVQTYRSHPAMMKVNGWPLVMPWLSCEQPISMWQSVRQGLRDKGLDLTFIADCDNVDYMQVFDGGKGTSASAGRNIRYYSVLADQPAWKIWMSNAQPGYDDRLQLDRDGGHYIDREDGQRFRTQLGEAMATSPEWVRIETWNEYWEGTMIEPTVSFGDKYLKIAGEYLLPWERCQATPDAGP